MKKILLPLLVLFFALAQSTFAQTVEELTQQKEMKSKELADLEGQLKELSGKVDGLKAEVAGLTDQLTPYPRWSVGSLGNLGFNVANFNNWLPKAQPNTRATTIGFTMNAFANLDQKKYFWRNGGNLTLGWLKFDDKDINTDSDEFQVSADAFNLSSLFGYKFSPKLAASALAEYRTSMLDGRFNNPGYFDIGAGATWTPMPDMVVVFHPLNYNFVFSDDDFNYESSLGCKIVADYTRKLTSNIGWKTNLSAFASYKGADLSNWTWVNSFSTAVKGVGIGFDLGLRSNKQESLAAKKTDNPLQTYWLLGLSYAIATKK